MLNNVNVCLFIFFGIFLHYTSNRNESMLFSESVFVIINIIKKSNTNIQNFIHLYIHNTVKCMLVLQNSSKYYYIHTFIYIYIYLYTTKIKITDRENFSRV